MRSTPIIKKRLGLHYLFFTGENDAGKSNNLTKINYMACRTILLAKISLLQTFTKFWEAEMMTHYITLLTNGFEC
jgi:hypothetical protein